jgi:hypothetical protein
VDILTLVNHLENLITSSQRMPMTNRVLVREQEVLQLIDQIRAAVPEEIKQARRLNQERDRVLAQAQAEASRIRAAAREEAERLINDEEMVQLATERAEEIEREAEERARQLRDGADIYAAETLRGLEEQLNSLQMQLDQTILSIHKGLETLGQRAAAGEEEELEETPARRAQEEAGAEEEEARLGPGESLTASQHTAPQLFPSQSAGLPRRLTTPFAPPVPDESARVNERGPTPQRRR